MKYPSTKGTQSKGAKSRGMGGQKEHSGGRQKVGNHGSVDPYAPQKACEKSGKGY